MHPKISVIVPCYNQAHFLDECLKSVMDQTYQNWECIIVNDGSPDNTKEIATRWTERDSRFKYLEKENGGLSSARNSGIQIAIGEWILPLDSDDKIAEKYLELAEKEFDKNQTVIYCNAEYFGDKTGIWEIPDFSLANIAYSNVIFCSAFFPKSKWQEVNGYDDQMIFGLEDWDFWISLLKNGESALKLNYTGFYYRIKESSMLKDLSNERLQQMKNIVFKKHINFFFSQQGSYHENLYKLRRLQQESLFLRNLYRSKLFRLLLKLKLLQ